MERLNKIIDQHGRWTALMQYIERINLNFHEDFSCSLENAKALLETISKEICKTKQIDLGKKPSINVVLKTAFFALGYPRSSMVTQISSALATIGQQMGDLRNEIGVGSHGKSLDQLKERNNTVDDLTKEMLIDTTVIVATFLIRNFENENPRVETKLDTKLLYTDNENFNEYWDESFGNFEMGNYSYLASEILYNVDFPVYETELKAFTENFNKDKDVS